MHDDAKTARSADADERIDCDASALAPSHVLALQLLAGGVPEAQIAQALDIPAEAVAPLLAVARAKLARIDAGRS